MALRPEDIESQAFNTSLRGYDKVEVDAFLRLVAAHARQLEDRLVVDDDAFVSPGPDGTAHLADVADAAGSETLTDLPGEEAVADRYGSLGDRIADLLRSADQSASFVREAAETEAAEVRQSAHEDAERIRAEVTEFREAVLAEAIAAREEAEAATVAILEEAERDAAAIREEADVEAERIRGDATTYAEQTRAAASTYAEEAEAEATGIRDEAEAEVQALRAEAEESTATLRASVQAESDEMRAATQAFVEQTRADALAYAEETRGAAMVDSRTVRDEAENEAARVRSEIEALRVQTEGSLEALRLQTIADANAELDAQRALLTEREAATNVDRIAAREELEQVRSQVSGLLEQARAQSEFIRQEAEEIIRTKIRANMEQAENRISTLRNTEISSRDRIVAAQKELSTALQRLESDPIPELQTDMDQAILAEAAARSAEAGYAPGEAASVARPEPEAAEPVATAGPVAEPVAEAAPENNVIEVEEWVAPTPPPPSHATARRSVDEGPSEASVANLMFGQPPAHDAASFPVEESEPGHPVEVPYVSEIVDAPPTDDEERSFAEVGSVSPAIGAYDTVGDHIADHLADGESAAPFATAAEQQTVGPENEDALARLVREAMQEAVDGARKNN